MARNTRIENPTRVAIATVEDQNKYQMARNRNIDQTNQFMETNVGADINVERKSDLVRLAESLKEANPIIQEYINRKEKEEVEKEFELGRKFAIENPVNSKEDAMKATLEKSIAFNRGYMTMFGHNSAVKDSAEFQSMWENLPEEQRKSTDVSKWVSEKIKEKNSGIEDVNFNSSYTNNIVNTISKMSTKSTIEKYEDIKEKYHSQVKEYLFNNNGNFLDNIDSYGTLKSQFVKDGPISNKEFDDMMFKLVEEKATTGNIEDLKFVEKFGKLVESNPKTKDGIPIFGKYANTGIQNKLTLEAIKSISQKRTLEKNLEKQAWEDTYNKTINEAFLLSRDGKVDNAKSILRDIMNKSTDILEVTEIRNYLNIIGDAYNEELELKNKQNKLTASKTSGVGGAKSSSGAKTDSDVNYDLLFLRAIDGDLTRKDVVENLKSGVINNKGAVKLLTEISKYSTEERRLENEENKEKREQIKFKNDLLKTSREQLNKSLIMPDPVSKSIGIPIEYKQAIKEKMASDSVKLRNEISKLIDEGKITNELEIEEYVSKKAERYNDSYSDILKWNPKTHFGNSEEIFRDHVKKQRDLEIKGVPIKNKLQDWQIIMAKQYFDNQKRRKDKK